MTIYLTLINTSHLSDRLYAVWKDVIRDGAMRAPTTTTLTADQRIANIKLTNNASQSPAKELALTWNKFTNFTLAMSDPFGVLVSQTSAVPYKVAVDGYPGWKGNAYFYKASIAATGPGTIGKSVSAQITRYFQLTNVPLFQAAIFYMDDLEIHPGALMMIRGLVHTNGDLYASGYSKLQFLGNVSYSGDYAEGANMGDWTGAGGTSATAPTVKPYCR